MTAVDLDPAIGSERVDPLVVAIGELDDVVTVETCEGGPGRDAYVAFRCRHGDGARLARELADLLAAHEHDIACELQAIWRPGAGASDPVIRLACPGEHVIALALMLRASGRSRRDGRLTTAHKTARPRRHLHAVSSR